MLLDWTPSLLRPGEAVTWAAAMAAAEGVRGVKDCCETPPGGGGRPMYPMPSILLCLSRIIWVAGSPNWLKLGPHGVRLGAAGLEPPRPLCKYDCELGV